LLCRSDLLPEENDKDRVACEIRDLSERLAGEIETQRSLMYSGIYLYHPVINDVRTSRILCELEIQFAREAEVRGINLIIPAANPDLTLHTDKAIVVRVLGNMIKNSLEASESGDTVSVQVHFNDTSITFSVWNRQIIPEKMHGRVFQRNYTTKEGLGRGVGTYSMKLFGEDILGGTVDFSSSEKKGTVFSLRLPRQST